MSKLTRNPKKYYDNYTEVISKIDSAVECASERQALKISESVSSETSKLSSVSASGDDAVESLVSLVQTIGNQFNTLASLANQYGSQIEPLYEKVQTQLKDLKKQEDSYKKICNDGPDDQSDKYYKTINNERKFQQALYDTDVRMWNDKLDHYEIQLQNMCIILDSIISQLSSVNSASIESVASNGFNFQVPDIIPFVTDDMISSVKSIEKFSINDGKVTIGDNKYNIEYNENKDAYINVDGQDVHIPGSFTEDRQKGMYGYFVSGMDGKKYIVFNQSQISGWGQNCNRAAAASIASAYTNDPWEAIKVAKKSKNGIGYKNGVTNDYFSNFGLQATIYSDKGKFKKYKEEILNAVTNKKYVMFHMIGSGEEVTGRSGTTWTGGSMHWVSILDYRNTESGYKVFISDSGRKGRAGWYSIDEFDNIKIDHYTVVSKI